MNKPSINKINFEYSSHILKCLKHISYQFFPFTLVKIISSVNSPPTCSFCNFSYKCI